MSEVVIEDNVPLTASYRNGRPASYPFRDMKVGQSIFIPASETDPHHAVKRAYATASRAGFKFSCRKQSDGVRVWRVE